MKWRNYSPQSLSDELTRLQAMEPYEILSVPSDATIETIKSAYRQMAKVYHPDKSDPFMQKHNEQVIKIINTAYERLLSDR